MNIEVFHDQTMQVGECPLWHPHELVLYWVDIDGFAVHRKDPGSGAHRQYAMDSEPCALAIHATGGLVVARRDGFVHLDTASGAVTQIAAAPYDTATTRFNDGRVDPAGRFWVGTRYEPGDQPVAEMFVLERGKVQRAWSGNMTNSNGLAFAPGGDAMYHADTTSHRIDRYDFDALAGKACHVLRFQQFDTDKQSANYGGRPDGAAVDSEGAYWCAMFEGARLLRFSAAGKLLQEVALPVQCPTMIAFGADDLRTLYITSASHKRPQAEKARLPLTGQVLALRVDVPGRVEHVYEP
ncbi:SMP-30/gluconolactonase/LRE family protein [Massilia sp. S19_KUP03_FR1]|uniref:SMP-30/gluconolactonase/LRE family protein n=1 Tax=Massilia sp. S19_KUP03_FR1 TaxID=3025503 RepID=UPI002FCCE622